ncbi:hypothetical protein ES708_20885 [subsurface metagenome]
MGKLEANWESLAKSYREISYQRRAVLQEVWSILQNATSPDEKLDTVKSLVKSSGIYIQEPE